MRLKLNRAIVRMNFEMPIHCALRAREFDQSTLPIKIEQSRLLEIGWRPRFHFSIQRPFAREINPAFDSASHHPDRRAKPGPNMQFRHCRFPRQRGFESWNRQPCRGAQFAKFSFAWCSHTK
jgi:hypothetical protein